MFDKWWLTEKNQREFIIQLPMGLVLGKLKRVMNEQSYHFNSYR